MQANPHCLILAAGFVSSRKDKVTTRKGTMDTMESSQQAFEHLKYDRGLSVELEQQSRRNYFY